jgi:hypothetical protein
MGIVYRREDKHALCQRRKCQAELVEAGLVQLTKPAPKTLRQACLPDRQAQADNSIELKQRTF